jgi:hypothetical protein
MIDSLSVQKELNLGVIYEPEAIAMTYDSVGWCVLFSMVGLVLLVLIYLVIKSYRKNAYRRQAQSMLNVIQNKFNSKEDFECVNETMALLKQVAMTTYGRDAVANLSGLEWLQFLDSKNKKEEFVPLSTLIHAALYQNKVSDSGQVKQLFSVTHKWINNHA